ncbi:hypothetical protein PR048_007373 [Dryococelus australis]|uniref:Uncharacterized protein n=1 Tax=Dryococelus australis TaxID=614101 RepID=A0ABQ9HV00_9NEOP|nr:hypothetical protein PR048_007373 [Dryococelus australis]
MFKSWRRALNQNYSKRFASETLPIKQLIFKAENIKTVQHLEIYNVTFWSTLHVKRQKMEKNFSIRRLFLSVHTIHRAQTHDHADELRALACLHLWYTSACICGTAQLASVVQLSLHLWYTSACICGTPQLASVVQLSLHLWYTSACICGTAQLASVVHLSLHLWYSSACICGTPQLASVVHLSLHLWYSSACICGTTQLASVVQLSLHLWYTSACICGTPQLASVVQLSLHLWYTSACICGTPQLASVVQLCFVVHHLVTPYATDINIWRANEDEMTWIWSSRRIQNAKAEEYTRSARKFANQRHRPARTRRSSNPDCHRSICYTSAAPRPHLREIR